MDGAIVNPYDNRLLVIRLNCDRVRSAIRKTNWGESPTVAMIKIAMIKIKGIFSDVSKPMNYDAETRLVFSSRTPSRQG